MYLIGYGSLVNRESLNSTLSTDKEMQTVELFHYKRCFNVVSNTINSLSSFKSYAYNKEEFNKTLPLLPQFKP